MKNYTKTKKQIERMLDYAIHELRSEAEYRADEDPFHTLQISFGKEGVHVDVSCERDGMHVVIIDGPGRCEYNNIENYAERVLNARACEQEYYYAAQRANSKYNYNSYAL